MRSYHGLHFQTPVTGGLGEIEIAALAGRPYRVIKGFWVELGRDIKAVSSSTLFVYRKHIEHQQPWLDRAFISPEEADRAADEFIFTFKDSVNQHGGVDYVESLNETYPSEDLVAQTKAVAFDRAFIRRLKVHCPNTKPVVYTAPPGNIDHDEYAILIPLARECQAAGGAFGPHNYWSVVNGHSYVNSPAHARDYHMRWADESLDGYLVARGIFVDYILGESGPIGAGPNGYYQLPNDGWLKDTVWNGNQDGYLRDLRDMDALYINTRAAQEDRLLGSALFTSGIGVGWDYFQIQQPFLERVTNYVIASSPVPPPEPPPPPPPPPVPGRHKKVVNLVPQTATILQKQLVIANRLVHEGKQTFMQSADDAVDLVRLGNSESFIKVWNPGDWEGDILSWLREKGVNMTVHTIPTGLELTHWPTVYKYVTQEFGVNPEDYARFGLPGHNGVDISAPLDTPIKSAAPGKVIRADYHTSYGWHVRMEHMNGRYITMYCHMAQNLNVSVGQEIPGGYKLGYSGNSGNSTGPHLHFEMREFPVGLAGWPYNIIDPTPFLEGLLGSD